MVREERILWLPVHPTRPPGVVWRHVRRGQGDWWPSALSCRFSCVGRHEIVLVAPIGDGSAQIVLLDIAVPGRAVAVEVGAYKGVVSYRPVVC